MSNKEVINTLISDYSIQAKLSERERLIYEHGILNGMDIANQMMMKDAVEAEITKISPNDHLRVVSDVLPLKDESEWGTKVKLIIIKED